MREFEEGQLRQLQETNERRRQLREQRAKLEAQRDFEQTKDFKGRRGGEGTSQWVHG